MSNSNEYNSSSIKVLKGLDAVRMRPGMYIGDTDDGSGLHHMVFEVVDNSIDEALAGYCKSIKVKIHQDGSVSVSDDGRGIPTEMHAEEGRSAAEVIMTVLHAGGKFDSNSYKVSGGLHGVGISVVNALSDKLLLTIARNGKLHQQEYSLGVPKAPLKVIGETTKTGTTVQFWPSPSIFANTIFKYETLANRLRELSFLNSGVHIELSDERDGKKDIFHYIGGLNEFVKFLNRGKVVLQDEPFDFNFDDPQQSIAVEIALQWTDTYQENVHCYTNNIPQKDGGTHLTAFKTALTRVVTTYIEREVLSKLKKGKLSDIKIDGEDVREGLTAIISVKVADPKFSSQTKEKLVSSEVGPVVSQTIIERLSAIFEEQPKIAQIISDKVIGAARSRIAARKARDLTRSNKSHFASPTKLVNCISNKPAHCELYLVEGDSAGGSAVKARDTRTQAILPLRGKILNVERARLEKVLESNEIVNIISTLKCGIGAEDFNIANLRYHKIVIMTDADVDGSHIRTLLLTFFYRHMPRLIEEGMIYIAQPPLYKVSIGTRKQKSIDVYLKNQQEYNDYLIDYSLNNIRLEVNDIEFTKPDLLPICKHYIKVMDFINSTNNKFSTELQTSLLYYPQLTIDDFNNKEKLVTWADGFIELLGKMHNQTIRFEYTIVPDVDNVLADYKLEFNVIKHGISESYTIDDFFVKSRNYTDIVQLSNEINKYLPVDGDLTNRFYIIGENKRQFVYFNQFFNGLMAYATEKLKPSRFKGLGEMNADELENTTMKASSRTLLQVKIEDAVEAEQMFSILLGDEVAPRRDFINEYAIYANVDI